MAGTGGLGRAGSKQCTRLGPTWTNWLMVHTVNSPSLHPEKFPQAVGVKTGARVRVKYSFNHFIPRSIGTGSENKP